MMIDTKLHRDRVGTNQREEEEKHHLTSWSDGDWRRLGTWHLKHSHHDRAAQDVAISARSTEPSVPSPCDSPAPAGDVLF